MCRDWNPTLVVMPIIIYHSTALFLHYRRVIITFFRKLILNKFQVSEMEIPGGGNLFLNPIQFVTFGETFHFSNSIFELTIPAFPKILFARYSADFYLFFAKRTFEKAGMASSKTKLEK